MLKIGYVPSHLPSYLAREYGVFDSSVQGLERLADTLGFELVSIDPVVTRADAERAADSMEVSGVDFVLLQSSSFAMGDVVLPFARRRFRLGIWATEEPTKEGPILLNNFVSMNLNAGILTRYLRSQRAPFKWFYGGVEHRWFAPRLELTVRALRAVRRLSRCRVALVGGIAPTFYNLVFDERDLKAAFGAEVFYHELGEVFTRLERIEEGAIRNVALQMSNAAPGRVRISERDLEVSAAVYIALKGFAQEHNYDTLAVSDWPAFQERLAIHPGMAFSWLDEQDGVPVASEGDVMGALSVLLGNEVSGGQAMLLDMNDVDEKREAALMWHCGGSPLGFADDDGISWVNHSTLGRKTDAPPMGAVADLRFRRQEVTVLRLAADARELFVVEGSVIDSPNPGYEGSRGWVAHFTAGGVPLSLADLVNTVMTQGIEHHFALLPGHHEAALREVAAWLDLGVTVPLAYQDYLQRNP